MLPMAPGIPKMTRPSVHRDCGTAARAAPREPLEQVTLAAELCAQRGARLTTIRRLILELLWRRNEPMGAYELIDDWKRATGRTVGPPTVYRALEFLIAQGLVSKHESRNAFVPCAHPEHHHICVFFICVACGASTELEDPEIEARLSRDAATLGFRIGRRIVEGQGTCAVCAGTTAMPPRG